MQVMSYFVFCEKIPCAWQVESATPEVLVNFDLHFMILSLCFNEKGKLIRNLCHCHLSLEMIRGIKKRRKRRKNFLKDQPSNKGEKTIALSTTTLVFQMLVPVDVSS